MKEKSAFRKKKKIIISFILLFLLVYATMIFYHLRKPLPEGLSFEGAIHTVEDVDMLIDSTYKKKDGNRGLDHQIIPHIIDEIKNAKEFIVIDMFLFNSDTNEDQDYPMLAEAFTNALIEKKQQSPSIRIIFITDKINTVYGSYVSPELMALENAGIEVMESEMKVLRDSNPLYSGLWRLFFQWIPTHQEKGILPNLLASSGPKVSIASYLELLNIKANHRKVVITDQSAIISSGNIHNASGYHSNIAYKVRGNIINDLLKSEESVSNIHLQKKFPRVKNEKEKSHEITVQLLTEGKIAKHVVQEIKQTKQGDTIWIGILYLANRQVINEIKEAANRNVVVQLILDPNQNSFGNKKGGLPNIPVAAELMKANDSYIDVRWYNTGTEQFHPKIMFIDKEGDNTIISGSANFTRRNLNDFNLETSIKIMASSDTEVMKETKAYFQKRWNNDGALYTYNYEKEEKTPIFRYFIYRLQQILGFTTY